MNLSTYIDDLRLDDWLVPPPARLICGVISAELYIDHADKQLVD
jgi:hypothetical protein